MKKVLAQGVTSNIYNQDPMSNKYRTLGAVVSDVLPYVYVAAGLAMFVVLIFGGIELMLASGDQGKMQAGYGKIKAALVGFFLVFLSFAIVQLLQTVLGFKVL